MIVVDTTILLYSVGGQHPLQAPCRNLINAVGNGLEATTTVEVIQEFLHVRSRRRTRRDASELAQFFAELMAPLLRPEAADLLHGVTLFEENPHVGAFDAILAATAVRRSAQLASADNAFSSVPGLAHVTPGTPQFEKLLG